MSPNASVVATQNVTVKITPRRTALLKLSESISTGARTRIASSSGTAARI